MLNSIDAKHAQFLWTKIYNKSTIQDTNTEKLSLEYNKNPFSRLPIYLWHKNLYEIGYSLHYIKKTSNHHKCWFNDTDKHFCKTQANQQDNANREFYIPHITVSEYR